MNPFKTRAAAALLLAVASIPVSATDLASHFDAGDEAWHASDPAAVLSWQAADGLPDGCLQGQTTGGVWYYSSPPSWSGDWSAFRTLKFDISMPSRHYADTDIGGMVVITGANAQTMTWTGPTPLWNWTHYEVSLAPESFDVDQATFDDIMANVARLDLLAEFTSATETVLLDNVIVTEETATVQENDLLSAFTSGTIEGWRPVDDVTLTAEDFGYPSMGLKANDWVDGRLYRIASPIEWAGDWSNFVQLSFDMHWSGTIGDPPHSPLLTVFGANGDTLTLDGLPTDDIWMHREIALTPATFGVDQATFDGVMAFVTHIWITGEFGSSDDITHLDNIRVTANPAPGPKVFETSLVSRFGSGPEGWGVFGNGELFWDETAGFTGGALTTADQGGGIQSFHSPDAWSGDWRAFSTLRFMLKTLGRNQANLEFELWIVTWDGTALYLTYPPGPWRSWTPYTIDLTPETFGVTPAEFEAVISDVAYLWIRADLVQGTGSADTTGLDEVSLVSSDEISQPPPEKFSAFDQDQEAWRNGELTNGGAWEFRTTPPAWYDTAGNPDGYIANTDVGDLAYWFSPESWAGDWRGYQSISFDETILSGSSLLDLDVGLSIASVWGNLDAQLPVLPANGSWTHYEFALTPAAFGVTQEEFDRIMRDVMALCIRSEWINGGEEEGLDNVRVTKTSDAYWAWIALHITDPADLANESIAGKFADPDRDGDDNWTEFLAQTVPVDPTSYLLLEPPAVSPGISTLSFLTHPGRTYQVERSTTLQPGSWVPVGPATAGDGILHYVEDVDGEPQAYYRLTLWLTP